MRIGYTLAIGVATLISHSAEAGIRCGNDLISIGDSTMTVMTKLSGCGRVVHRETLRTEEEFQRGKWVTVTVTEWYIVVEERGRKYGYPLTFKGGRLIAIGRWHRM